MEWSGKIIGAVVGLASGPLAAGFGLVLGHLVDTARNRGTVSRDIEVFLLHPGVSAAGAISRGLLSLFVLGIEAARTAALTIALPRVAFARLVPADGLTRRAFGQALREVEARLTPTVGGLNLGSGGRARLVSVHAAHLVRLRSVDERLVMAAELARLVGAGGLRISVQTRSYLVEVCRLWRLDPARVLPEKETSAEAWTILGLAPGAGVGEVKRVYRLLARHFHPDGAVGLAADQMVQTEEAFRKVESAYRVCLAAAEDSRTRD